MNKPSFVLFAFLMSSAVAYGGEAFTCEQIKEKSVRESCIASRKAAEVKPVDERKVKKELFVAEAKRRLVADFKDPQSSQFSDLSYLEEGVMDSSYLCGKVNAKNSYGGYVGAKLFYVQKRKEAAQGSDGWTVWVASGEPSPMEVIHLKMMSEMCSNGNVEAAQ
jgi:hypothetical protein